jgi:hypothetical protein
MGTPANIVIGGATITIGSDLGYIKDGLHLSKEEEVYYVTGIEGLPTPPMAHRTSLQYSISGTLIEPSILDASPHIALVYGGTDTAGTTGVLELGLAAEMDIVNNLEKAVSIMSIVPATEFIRTIAAARCTADGPGEMVFTDAEEVSLPFTFKVLWDTTGSDQSIIITDAAA